MSYTNNSRFARWHIKLKQTAYQTFRTNQQRLGLLGRSVLRFAVLQLEASRPFTCRSLLGHTANSYRGYDLEAFDLTFDPF